MRSLLRMLKPAVAAGLLAAAGCGGPARPGLELAAETPAEPPVAAEGTSPGATPAPRAAAAPAGTFDFRADLGGELLRRVLTPAGPPALPADPEGQPGRVPRKPLATLDAPRLALTPFPGSVNPVPVRELAGPAPRPLPDGPPLDYLAKASPTPGVPPMPATPPVPEASTARDVPVPLPVMAKRQPDRASLDDPTATFSTALVTAAAAPTRSGPAEFLPLSRPDPFENATLGRVPAKPLADDPTVEVRSAVRPVRQ